MSVCLAACEEEPPQAQEVRDAWDALLAVQAGEGETYASLLAAKSIRYYDQLLNMARTSSAGACRNLPAAEKLELVAMRHRLTPQQLKTFDGRRWVVHVIDSGWFEYEESEYDFVEETLGRVRVDGDTASAQVLWDGEDAGYEETFLREDGRWKYLFLGVDKAINEWILDIQEATGMDEDEVIIWSEEEDSGQRVPDNIWDPPKL